MNLKPKANHLRAMCTKYQINHEVVKNTIYALVENENLEVKINKANGRYELKTLDEITEPVIVMNI